jgi:hypothetical protein
MESLLTPTQRIKHIFRSGLLQRRDIVKSLHCSTEISLGVHKSVPFNRLSVGLQFNLGFFRWQDDRQSG